MSKYQLIALGDLAADEPGAISIGPFGSAMKADTYTQSGVPVIRGTNISDTRAWKGDWVYIPDALADTMKRCVVVAGDLVLPHRGSIGEVAIIPKDHLDRYFISSSLMKIRLNATKIEPMFCYYYLRSDAGRSEILQYSSSVGTPGIGQPLASMRQFRVPVPPLAEQRAIAATLGALDDKIELNRRMNETLEAMARALFRDWFVDFGPTRAKMAGQAPYLSPALWDLFPASIDAEGKPEGWDVSNLASVLTVLETGRRPKGGVAGISGGVPSVGAESIDGVGKFDFGKTKYVSEEFFRGMAKGHISEGDVLIYKDGGKPGELRPSVSYVSNGFPFDRFCINEHVFRARSDSFDQAFLYCLLSTDGAFAQMRELATGVAQPGLNQVQMGRLSFILPNCRELIDHASGVFKTLIDACNVNAAENRSLAQTRDLLLPRLMSGELRVAEAEQTLAGVL